MRALLHLALAAAASLATAPRAPAAALPGLDQPNPWLARDLSRADLLPQVAAAADYLVRNQLDDGQFVYIKDPLGVQSGGDRYSLIRHLGAAYALLRANVVTHDQRYLDAGARALAFAKTFAGTDGVLRGLTGKPNIGENGFYLIDLVLYTQITGRTDGAQVGAPLVKFLTAALRFDGPYATPEHWAESQGLIGLMWYHTLIEATPAAVAAARAWVAAASADEPSHWSVQAEAWLYRAEPTPALAKAALAHAHTILADVKARGDAPERLVGSRGGKLYSCNATARAEGLLAAHRLALSVNEPSDAGFFFARAREHLAYAMQFQFGAAGSLVDLQPLIHRAALRFGLTGGLVDDVRRPFVRIDYTAHFIRAATAYLESPAVPGSVGLDMRDLVL